MLKITPYGEVTRFDLARTIAGRGRYWTTAYLVDGLLVDSGCAHSAPELARALAEAGLARLVNTHTHEDHIGANGLLQRQYAGLQILAHPLALPVLADPAAAQPLHPYRRFFWGWPEPSQARPLANGELVETERCCFRVIYTPGHSVDHICLYEAERGWLFSGDLFVGGQDRALRAGCDIWEIIASLKRIAALPIQALYPGSARAREAPQDELFAKIAYLEELGQRVIALQHQGRSLSEIVQAEMGDRKWIEVVTRGHFSRHWLVRSYLRLNEMHP
ncbi:MAG: MBL fold metallo-hydrolase [Anaerolineales bacterium]|nr:MBL fold metallo-hydrolase [Anaerolineales bacterium]